MRYIVFTITLLVLFSCKTDKEEANTNQSNPKVKGETAFVQVNSSKELQKLTRQEKDELFIELSSGRYELKPMVIFDRSCGNCENPDTTIKTTAGLWIDGKKVVIKGPKDGSAVIVTNASYGLYFMNCEDCKVENVTITGGVRSEVAMASDAGIVVKNSKVSIKNCNIIENMGDVDLVKKHTSGIMGICGRENSTLTIENCKILQNSWDGIALYRNAVGTINNNVIDGVDVQRGKFDTGGRGVGIGLTHEATARITNNFVARYWKGIGVFVDAQAEINGNIVEQMITWGISVWSADKGNPSAIIQNNLINEIGACGVSITVPDGKLKSSIQFRRNTVVRTGYNNAFDSPQKYCFQCALSLSDWDEGFLANAEAENSFYNNRRAATNLPNLDGPGANFKRSKVKNDWCLTLTQDHFANVPSMFRQAYCQ